MKLCEKITAIFAAGALTLSGCSMSKKAEQQGVAEAQFGYVHTFNFEGDAYRFFRGGLAWKAEKENKSIENYDGNNKLRILCSIDANNDFTISTEEARKFYETELNAAKKSFKNEYSLPVPETANTGGKKIAGN